MIQITRNAKVFLSYVGVLIRCEYKDKNAIIIRISDSIFLLIILYKDDKMIFVCKVLSKINASEWRNSMAEYKRVLLKLSGEALAGDKKNGFDEDVCRVVAKQVKQLIDRDIQVAIVIGGGNFWRGRTSKNIERTKADQIGMLATIMNCVYVSEVFRSEGMGTQVMTPFECGNITKLYAKDDAMECLNNGKIVFFAGGTGHPYFSTDTATVLRAIEIEADAILLAKAIDGVYDSDPAINPNAKKYDTISIEEVLDKKLAVIDLSATIMCLENKMPMLIFGLNEENSIVNSVIGEFNGTRVTV